MNNRIREIRNIINMNQSEFASKIGIGQAALSAIEKGIRGLTDRNIQLICSTFNVNEDWLRYGVGEKFVSILPEDEYMKAAASISKSNDYIAMQAVIEYWKLDDNGKQLLKDFLYKIVDNSKKEE